MSAMRVSDGAWRALLALRGGQDAARPSPDDEPAWALYEPLARRRRESFVVAQVGQSLDGRVATVDGDAAPISGPDGFAHLHRLRALADAVVVGAGCVVADDPQLTVREVSGPSPVRVLIDPNGRVPADARCLSGEARTILVRARDCRAPAPCETIHLARGEGDRLSPRSLLDALADRGLVHVLVEGGAATIRHFLEAGLVDRLHVSVAPIVIGSGAPGLTLSPVSRLSQALRPRCRTYDLGNDTLFDCAFEDA
ncbi:RibD family protein [Aureimonas flava]|uniref:RibD family protein n=1 Tax=Aureimonas flava TaxID=2320271 RepID=A0A3A1WUB7_9HYPH|nr:RibD family protein [Aureimonas flava]RIY02013.1 RibD family protein [Aureimonas flava]